MNKFNCVLLVDDDGVTNFVNFKIIKKLNISDNVHSEMNGEKALNFIQYYSEKHDTHSPELIILDLKMPILDGFEFLEYLKIKKFKNKDKIKIIVLTGLQDQKEKEQADSQYDITYLQKPLTEEKLKAALSKQLVFKT